MEPEGSLPYAQEPTTDSCPELDKPNLHCHILFLEYPP
jgi:hypothetical protein